MSLLLDALKKAAEKKAKLGTRNEKNDATEIDETALDATEQHSTVIDSTLRAEPTELTSLEATSIDATELDATATEFSGDKSGLTETTQEFAAIDVTQHEPLVSDKTVLDDSTELQATSIDETSLEQTELDSTALDATELDSTALDATELDSTTLDATDLDSTALDATELDATATSLDSTNRADTTQNLSAIDVTQLDDPTSTSQFIDSTAMEATELTESTQEIPVVKAEDTGLDELEATVADTTALEQTSLDTTVVDSTTTSTLSGRRPDDTGPKLGKLDLTDSDHAEFDIEQDFNLGDDQTTQIGEDYKELNYFGLDSDLTATMQQTGEKTFEIPSLKVDPDAEELLTEDDVTEFMGDGFVDVEKKSFGAPVNRKHPVSSDDTTLTNSESLSLTNFGYDDLSIDYQDEDRSLILDETASDTDSLHGYPESGPNTTGLSLEEIPSDVSTRVATDSTSTSSSIDIDQLTNDETVTVEGKTSTRTFAPDNYDRTLLNMSDKDASRIFPGMRPDSDAVMTPDYAKKVFLSRSGQQKSHYYKIYAGVGLLLLLVVVLAGLFDLQGEAELIDQRVAGLKRDPMPGVIKSNIGTSPVALFSATDENADIKALDVLATADRESTNSGQQPTQNLTQIDAPESVPQKEVPVTASAKIVDKADTPLKVQQELAKPAEKMQATTVKPEPVATSSLQVSVKNEQSSKDKILNEAYQSYVAGDLNSARSSYSKVLELDQTNRDALLGRAAIHIQDNEYQLAIDKYQQILEQNPKDSMAMTSLIAVANIDPQAGEAQLKNLIYEQSDAAYLHFALGNLYGSQNRWTEAQKAYFDAYQYHPQEPNYAYNLAVSLEHIGKPAVAINYYQKALDNRSKGLATFNSELVVARIEVLTQ